MRKAVITVALSALPLAATYLYLVLDGWMRPAPCCYEDTLHALVVAAGASVVTLIAVTTYYIASYLRHRRQLRAAALRDIRS